MPLGMRRDDGRLLFSGDGSTPSMTGRQLASRDVTWPDRRRFLSRMRVTRSTIGTYDPGFHIAPLFIRLKSILARDGLVAVIGRMAGSGNRVSIYRIETQQLLHDCIHSL